VKIYKIQKGNHYSGLHFKPHIGETQLSHTIEFNKSAHYYFGDDDQLDINKLFGLSFGFHHNNSVRFGWRSMKPYTNQIEILAYIYLDGKRLSEINKNLTVGYVDINKPYEYKFMVSNNTISMYIIDTEQGIQDVKTFVYSNKLPKIGYYLYPYFGGQKPAIQDISIKFLH